MDKTKIEWTDATWNALRGCSKCSAGCANCYAEGMAARFSNAGQWGYGLATRKGGKHRWTGVVVMDIPTLLKPLRWRKPRRVFVTSVSEPFHPQVTDEMLDLLFAVMTLCPRHTFQLLTKRPERMLSYLGNQDLYARVHGVIFDTDGVLARPIPYPETERTIANMDVFCTRGVVPNVWLGATIENQQTYNDRAGAMSAMQAAGWRTFASAEPLLGPVTLHRWVPDWLIAGGESGRNARPMHPAWPRELRDTCALAGVPFFFKQWGEWLDFQEATCPGRVPVTRLKARMHTFDGGIEVIRVGKKAAGHELDGHVHHAFPEGLNHG